MKEVTVKFIKDSVEYELDIEIDDEDEYFLAQVTNTQTEEDVDAEDFDQGLTPKDWEEIEHLVKEVENDS